MTALLLIRHGPTAWNEAGRIQGRSDQHLSPEGGRLVERWRLPDDLHGFRWVCSPLRRARQTADRLRHPEAEIVPELIEADWGAWEGLRLQDLRAELGEEMSELESRGLDFQPPGGESPRDLQVRLDPFFRLVGRDGTPTAAVTHKGVIRATYALASGWDMKDKPPEKLTDNTAHLFRVTASGRVTIDRLNIPLLP